MLITFVTPKGCRTATLSVDEAYNAVELLNYLNYEIIDLEVI